MSTFLKRLFWRGLVSTLFAALVHPTSAQAGRPRQVTPAPPPPHTVVLSDTLHYDDLNNTSVFKGRVILTRGHMKLYADELQTHEDAQGHQYGTALAAPAKMVTVQQERPDTFELLQGKGQRAEYNDSQGVFDLIGQAEVIRYICGKPIDTIRGQRVRYNEKAGTYEAIGGQASAGPHAQVHSILEPRANIEAAIAACRKEKASAVPKPPHHPISVPPGTPSNKKSRSAPTQKVMPSSNLTPR